MSTRADACALGLGAVATGGKPNLGGVAAGKDSGVGATVADGAGAADAIATDVAFAAAANAAAAFAELILPVSLFNLFSAPSCDETDVKVKVGNSPRRNEDDESLFEASRWNLALVLVLLLFLASKLNLKVYG